MPPPRQAVPYAALLRVSSVAQQQAATIETQRAELRRWVAAQGADPDGDVLWFEDEAVSGDVPLMERDGGGALVAAIEAGRVTRAVVMYAIDRLNRGDIISYFTLEALCEARGLSLVSISQGVDTATEGGQLAGGIYALFAREAKRHMLAATLAGTRRAAREGKWLARLTPYGFRKVDQRLEIDHEAAATIRMACRLITEEGMSGRAAFLHLRALGLYPFAHLATFLFALHNPALAGRAEHFRTRMVRRGGRVVGRVKRPASERIVIPCPAILSEDEFEALQRALAGPSGKPTGKYAALYWLPPLYCAACGARYYYDPRQWARYYQHRKGTPRGPGCGSSIRADPIEAAVWGAVQDAIRDVAAWRAAARARMAEGRPDASNERAALQGRLQALTRGMAQLDAALLRGTISAERYDAQSIAAEGERVAIAAELRRIERAGEAEAAAAARIGELEGKLRDARRLTNEATIEEKRDLAAALIERVEVSRDDLPLRHGGALDVRVVWRG